MPGLPEEVQTVLKTHGDAGTTDAKEYQDALKVFYAKHAYRLDPLPDEVLESFRAMEEDPTVSITQ